VGGPNTYEGGGLVQDKVQKEGEGSSERRGGSGGWSREVFSGGRWSLERPGDEKTNSFSEGIERTGVFIRRRIKWPRAGE